MQKKTHMLIILDGWGMGTDEPTNAALVADTPFLDHLVSSYPRTQLGCSGQDVGLPTGIMGNSEVGHQNIGAGRIVYQDLLRIDRAIGDGSFFRNEIFTTVMSAVAEKGSALHLLGLVSDGGVHSQLDHLLALVDLADQKGLKRVFVHAILDGRDTPPKSAHASIECMESLFAELGAGRDQHPVDLHSPTFEIDEAALEYGIAVGAISLVHLMERSR